MRRAALALALAGCGGASDAGTATVTAGEACGDVWAALCASAQRCGLVLAELPAGLVCVESCDALRAAEVAPGCEARAAGASYDPADVAACVAALDGASCAQACGGVAPPACAPFSPSSVAAPPSCAPGCVR